MAAALSAKYEITCDVPVWVAFQDDLMCHRPQHEHDGATWRQALYLKF